MSLGCSHSATATSFHFLVAFAFHLFIMNELMHALNAPTHRAKSSSDCAYPLILISWVLAKMANPNLDRFAAGCSSTMSPLSNWTRPGYQTDLQTTQCVCTKNNKRSNRVLPRLSLFYNEYCLWHRCGANRVTTLVHLSLLCAGVRMGTVQSKRISQSPNPANITTAQSA